MADINHSSDYLSIRNTIAEYCVALDNKDWSLLHQVFTEDVDASYPFGRSKGVQVISDTIRDRFWADEENRLQHITSQHALTTQKITIADDGGCDGEKEKKKKKTASAMTYFTASHFGKGKWEGQVYTAWGKYVDELILLDDGDGEDDKRPSSPVGHWRISRREVSFMGRNGDGALMKGDE